MVPTRRWLVAAFYDEETERGRLSQDIRDDVSGFMAVPSLMPFPYDVDPVIEWIPVDELRCGHDDYADFFNRGIAEDLSDKLTEDMDYTGLVLLLDHDLLLRNSVGYMYVPLITHRYFSNEGHPNHFVYCFSELSLDTV